MYWNKNMSENLQIFMIETWIKHLLFISEAAKHEFKCFQPIVRIGKIIYTGWVIILPVTVHLKSLIWLNVILL
jgi:hypothetical protein